MAQITDIVLDTGELLRSEPRSPRSPGEGFPQWSMTELVGAASLAMSTEPDMVAATNEHTHVPVTATAVLGGTHSHQAHSRASTSRTRARGGSCA